MSSYGDPADQESEFNTICAGHTPRLPPMFLPGANYGPEPESVAYADHPAFSHGSMPMTTLNSGFDTPPVANASACLDSLGFCNPDGGWSPSNPSTEEVESPELASSPEYGRAVQDTTSVTSAAVASPDYRRSPTGSEVSTLRDYESEPSQGPTSDYHTAGGHTDDESMGHDSTCDDLAGSVPVSPQNWFVQDDTRVWIHSQACRDFGSDNPTQGIIDVGWQGGWAVVADPMDSPFVNPVDPYDRYSSGPPGFPLTESRLAELEAISNFLCPGVDRQPQVHFNTVALGFTTYDLPQPTHTWTPAPVSVFHRPTKSRSRKYHANLNTTRYEDGEVLRYGAGESYRPFNNRDNRDRERSPRRPRSPLRDRDHRVRTPPVASDSYVPNRSPRRRSRSPDRYRAPDRARDSGGENWRRRDSSRGRARSPPAVRRVSPRRSPRRSPNRYSPAPRRDDRFDRARSPRRDFDIRDQRRSRSPFDRERRDRPRSPIRRSPPPPRVGASYRPRSRSPDRRDDRYGPGAHFRRPSPPILRQESAVNSTRTSRSNSRSRNPSPRAAPSPRPISRGYDNRSRQHSPIPHSPAGLSDANAIPVRNATPRNQTPLRSPPRGPAALRAPPTGPSATRNFTAPSSTPAASRYPTTPAGPQSRTDVTSPTIPPSGPRGYVPPPRSGGFGARGGRGGWSATTSRFAPPPMSPVTPHSASTVPTGPRASISQAASPSTASRPFNPPTGPASQGSGGGSGLGHGSQRPTLAQNLIANMPPILPQGRIDPLSNPLRTGVTKDLEAHHQRLKEEEERIRADLRAKDAKLRHALGIWERLDRESRAYELKSELSDQSLKTIAGEGVGGAAF